MGATEGRDPINDYKIIRKELEKNETIPSISINDVNWTSSKTIEITYPEGYKNEYSLDLGTTWNEYTEPITVETNTTIFTRVVKDEKVIGSSSFVVTSIDNVEPEISLDIDETIDKGTDIKIPRTFIPSALSPDGGVAIKNMAITKRAIRVQTTSFSLFVINVDFFLNCFNIIRFTI